VITVPQRGPAGTNATSVNGAAATDLAVWRIFVLKSVTAINVMACSLISVQIVKDLGPPQGGFDAMKRWVLVSCLVLISALGVLIPAGAQASTVSGGQLTSGKPVTATISTSGQQVEYTFAATANKNVTFNVTHFDFTDGGGPVEVFLVFYEPGSSSSYTQCDVTGNTYCNFTTPVGGTWKLVVVPYAASVGSLTLTFANNVPTKALTSGIPVTTTIKYEGQQAGYTFAATAKKNVTFNVTHFDFTDNGPAEVFLVFYEPGSSSSYTQCDITGNTYCNFTAPVGGTWSIALVPYAGSVGSLTLTFANDVPTKALSSGVPVTTTIKYEGQQAGYTFAATADKSVTFKVTHFNFTDNGPAEVFLVFYEPGSSSSYTQCDITGNTTCPVKTPVGGTWSIALVPYAATVGSLTLTMN
jgi:hypothetical protein